MEASFELSLQTFSDVLFCPLHGTLGFITIYQSINVKFLELPQCFNLDNSLILLCCPLYVCLVFPYVDSISS